MRFDLKFLAAWTRWWLVLIWVVFLAPASPTQAAAFVVTSLADAGAGTLRQAIIDANANAEADTITFAIAGTITLNSALPPLSDADGIAIDGGGITITPAVSTTIAQGFRLTTDNHTIQNVIITGFTNGIVINDGANNTIGPGNVISGNTANGVIIEGIDATGNSVIGSLIGTTAGGNAANANGGSGVVIRDGASGNIIGAAGQRNTISGNDDYGILIQDPLTAGNTVQSNFIGLNELGIAALPNNLAGVRIENGADGNTIGGGGIAARNVISGNRRSGIEVSASDTTTIQNNTIGLNDAGNTVIANNSSGIRLLNGSQSTAVSANVISGNRDYGIDISGGSGHNIATNCIGTAGLLGTCLTSPLGNSLDGIRMISVSGATINGNTLYDNRRHGINSASGSSGSTITNNTIQLNWGRGVLLQAGSGHTIQDNSIFGNTGLGIDLLPSGVTPNDPGDGDGGVNTRQNFPVLTAAANNGILRVSFNSTPNATFTLQFFSNAACHSSGYGQGETLLFTDTITTNASGSYTFEYTGLALIDGTYITATATNSGGSTSEFSRCRQVVAPAPIANFSATPVTGTAPLNVSFTDLSTGIIDNWLWDFGDGTTSTAQNPGHQFTQPGTYTVTLTVSSIYGTDSITRTITVTAPSPTPPPAQPAATATPTLTLTPSPTFTPSLTFTPSGTPSPTPSTTPTATASSTATNTATATSTVTPSRTSTLTPTASSTPSATPTASPSATPSATATQTPTPTPPPTSTATATATLLPTLAVNKIDQPDGVRVEISNTGAGDALDVQVSETLRDGVVYVSSRPGAPICVEDAGVVYCALDTVAAGESAAVDINLNASGPSNTSGQTVVSAAGLQPVVVDAPYISKIGDPPVAEPGSTVTYTIRVINPTDQTATGVSIQDTMPAAIEILAAESTRGRVLVSGQDISLSLDQLSPGERVTITIQTRVREDESFNQIINEACLSSSANPAPSCARMSFLRVSQIPATGETPPLRRYLFAAMIALVAAGAVLAFNRLRATVV